MRDTKKCTRRNFLKGAGIGAAGLATAGMFGCAPSAPATSDTPDSSTAASSWRTAPEPIADDAIAETIDCKILIIGLSYAGSAAFRAATEAGASVVAMEMHAEDSHSWIGNGHFGHINSTFLKERGVTGIDPVEFLNNWQLRAANRSNAALARKFTHLCGPTFDWYIDCLTQEERDGMEIQFFPTADVYEPYKNGIGTYIGTAGTSSVQEKILNNLVQTGVDRGGTVHWGTTAQYLTVSDDGRVTGAIGKKSDGTYLRVTASKGVIVAAGDYSGNTEMAHDLLEHITRMLGDSEEIVGNGYQGDGLKMCCWAGGRIDPYQATMGGDYYYPCDSPMDPLGSAAALWINAEGERYCNEGFGFMEWSAYAGALQPQGIISTVFDSNYEALIKAQPACHMAVDYPNGGMDRLPQTLAATVAGGANGSADPNAEQGPMPSVTVYAANDYKTLGEYLGYEGSALDNFVASIERYNAVCEAGIDEDFGKESSLLFPVKEPPFYAYAGEKTVGSMLCTTAGALIDENGQVIGQDFRPIPGLFAAGNTAGSRFGIQYTTALCGVSIAFAVTQGKFTAEYVASLA